MAVVLFGGCSTGSARHVAETRPDLQCSISGSTGGDTVEQRVNVPRDGRAEVEVGPLRFSAEYVSSAEDRELTVQVADERGRVVDRVRYVIPGDERLRNQFGEERDAITGDHIVESRDTDAELSWRCSVSE